MDIYIDRSVAKTSADWETESKKLLGYPPCKILENYISIYIPDKKGQVTDSLSVKTNEKSNWGKIAN